MPLDQQPYQDFQQYQFTPGSGKLGSDHSSLMNQFQILNQEEHASIFSHTKLFNASKDPATSSQFNSLQEDPTPKKKAKPTHLDERKRMFLEDMRMQTKGPVELNEEQLLAMYVSNASNHHPTYQTSANQTAYFNHFNAEPSPIKERMREPLH